MVPTDIIPGTQVQVFFASARSQVGLLTNKASDWWYTLKKNIA